MHAWMHAWLCSQANTTKTASRTNCRFCGLSFNSTLTKDTTLSCEPRTTEKPYCMCSRQWSLQLLQEGSAQKKVSESKNGWFVCCLRKNPTIRLEIVEVRCHKSIIFCMQYESDGGMPRPTRIRNLTVLFRKLLWIVLSIMLTRFTCLDAGAQGLEATQGKAVARGYDVWPTPWQTGITAIL